MSGIQIIIPLDALPPGTALTPEALIEAVGKTEELTARNRMLQHDVNNLAEALRATGHRLETIVENMDGMEQARAVRQLIADLKAFKNRSETHDS